MFDTFIGRRIPQVWYAGGAVYGRLLVVNVCLLVVCSRLLVVCGRLLVISGHLRSFVVVCCRYLL